jgi:hypothetical protein
MIAGRWYCKSRIVLLTMKEVEERDIEKERQKDEDHDVREDGRLAGVF